MLSRLAVCTNSRIGCSLLSLTKAATPRTTVQNQFVRNYRGRATNRTAINTNVSESLKQRIGPLEVGQAVAAGGAVLGLGALCFYGLGLSNEAGAIDRAAIWPEYVRTRVRDTYLYFGASMGVAASTAIAVFRSPHGHKFFALCERHPILSTVGIIAAVIGTGTAMMSVPYTSDIISAKHALWLLNCGTLGLIVAPIGALGGAIAYRAAWYTAGIVGGLSTVAACAPSDKFLNWAGPLGIGLGGVFMASIGSAFVPATTTLGLSLYSISLYGGLVIFSGFLLYDTQKIIRKAETHPAPNNYYYQRAVTPYDPINASHGIVMDTLNIFIRIAQILAMGGNRRK